MPANGIVGMSPSYARDRKRETVMKTKELSADQGQMTQLFKRTIAGLSVAIFCLLSETGYGSYPPWARLLQYCLRKINYLSKNYWLNLAGKANSVVGYNGILDFPL